MGGNARLSNGSTIHVVDLRQGRTVAVIDLGKEVRPHSAHFGPDGLLYVSAEFANAISIVDTKTRSLVGEIPTGASRTHMFSWRLESSRAKSALAYQEHSRCPPRYSRCRSSSRQERSRMPCRRIPPVS
jgi:DNA-binding beta-propeller fold protein YncE